MNFYQRYFISIFFSTIFTLGLLSAQLDEACKLNYGTNLSGLVDYGTELPFVDLMHNAREWYTKDVDNPNAPFDSGNASFLTYRDDGYPTHIPQSINESIYDQRAVTIWAITTGWPKGNYTVLFDGKGKLSFWGGLENLVETSENRLTFDFYNTEDNALEMTILESDINDPIRNIRVLMPGTEETYESQPFYSLWLEKLSIFKAVRFMDWGMTNSWGQVDNWTWDDPSLFNWDDRAQVDNYTWANSRGIPYEMMIQLMNLHDYDGWVCVPHRADDDYIEKMAELFKENLEPDRHLTVEYSNEIWNWIFGQTQWLNKYGCVEKDISWPEGIVPYIQNCLDIWTEVYGDDVDRITRVVGVQTSWQDVSNRMANNLTSGSFDAISPTYYFGLTEEGDAALDNLGANATVDDVAFYARQGMESSRQWIESQKNELADPLGLPLMFYEGGQHITGHPFGEEPTYFQALLDIQRDTAMYNMYKEWEAFLRTLQVGDEPLTLMNFSFVKELSARYGSWGILETMDQDISTIPAPKYAAIAETINGCNSVTSVEELSEIQEDIKIFPNPASTSFHVTVDNQKSQIYMYNTLGNLVQWKHMNQRENTIDIEKLNAGIYGIKIISGDKEHWSKIIVVD